METTASNISLTASQLAALMSKLPGEPGALSPLRSHDIPRTQQASASLPESVSRQPDLWQPVAKTLLAPQLALVTSAGTSDSVVYLHAFGGPATGEQLVGCTRGPDGIFDIAATLDAKTWGQVLWEGLALDAVADVPDAVVPMSINALMACCGLVDAIKESRLEAVIAREPFPAPSASTASIAVAAKAGLMVQDARWFTGLVRRLLPNDPAEIGTEQIHKGLEELGRIGWVTPEGDDGWTFSETMLPHATQWGATEVSGLFSLHLDDPRGLGRLHLGIIRTLSGLWTIECPPDGTTVKVGTTGGKALMLLMMKAVKTLLASIATGAASTVPGQTAATSSRRSRFCAACGAAVVDGARFCAGCGKPVAPPESKPSCPSCGKPTKAEQKFCAGCGHRLA